MASDRRGGLASYILAGGASRRFGSDKALAEIGGRTMLARMLPIAGAARRENARDRLFVIGEPEKYRQFGAVCVGDRWPGEGPLGGVVTGLEHTRDIAADCEWSLILSCDMPFLTAKWVSFLAQRAASSRAEVVYAHSAQGPEPLCACWRASALSTLRPAFESGVRKVTAGIALLRAEVLDEAEWKRFDTHGRLFWNMNTREDYEEARRILETEENSGRTTAQT